MKMQNYELRLLVGGNPIHEYEHNGNTFVEGRKGSEFEVEFKNNSGNRLMVVPSVDGVSTLDGKPATLESSGYVVNAYQSLIIPGWRVDENNVANFLFMDKEHSYVRTQTNSSATAGVVGVLVYGEEAVQTTVFPPNYIEPAPIQPYWVQTPLTGQPPLLNQPWFGSSLTTRSCVSQTMASTKNMSEPFEMGTGWGSKSDFKTNPTTFNRGKLRGQMAIYYDTRRNLEKRGIQVVKRERSYLNSLPSPFQTGGCTPPDGWNGN